MSGFTPVPKPVKQSDREKNIARIVKAWSRNDRWRKRAIERAKGKPRTKVKTGVGRTKQRRMKEYAEYLKSPAWKALRKIVFERDGYRCVDCGAEAGYFVSGKRDVRGLECDHETYIRLFHELPEDCRTRCRNCHRAKHAKKGWANRVKFPYKLSARG